MQFLHKWWMEQPDAKRAWMATLSLSVGAILVGWLVLAPMFINVQTLASRKNQLTLEVGALSTFAQAYDEHEKERAQLLADSAAWRGKMPEQVKAADVLRQLDAQALQAGISLTAVKPQAVRTNASLTEMPFEISAAGDFFAARRFLQQIERQSTPAMRVVSFTLSTEPNSGLLKQVYVVASPGLTALPKTAPGGAPVANALQRGITAATAKPQI